MSLAERYGSAETPLVPAVIKGWRAFALSEACSCGECKWSIDGEHLTPKKRSRDGLPKILRSIVVELSWVSSEWQTALCRRPNRNRCAPPSLACTCGFYAAHTFNALEEDIYSVTHFVDYVGFVEGSGKVLVGPKGWRAERQRVVAVAPAGLRSRIWVNEIAIRNRICGQFIEAPDRSPFTQDGSIEVYQSVAALRADYPDVG